MSRWRTRSAKGIVKREVVKVVTPGTVIDAESLSPKENNYLLALYTTRTTRWGLSYLDISTGEFRVTEVDGKDAAFAEVACVNPREIILPLSFRDNGRPRSLARASAALVITYLDEWVYDADYAGGCLSAICGAFPVRPWLRRARQWSAAGAVLHYFRKPSSGRRSMLGLSASTPTRTIWCWMKQRGEISN